MITTRCKFIVQSVTKYKTSENVVLTPVTSGSSENESFSKYTPAGKLEISITNEKLFDKFKPGVEYYLDISEVDAIV